MYHVAHNTCTMHGRNIKHGILGRHQSFDSERIDILSDSIECNHPSRNTSSLLDSKSCQIENWKNFFEKTYVSLQLPPKISLRHDWTQDLSSKVDRHPQEGVVRQSRGEIQHSTFSQLTQPVPKPNL